MLRLRNSVRPATAPTRGRAVIAMFAVCALFLGSLAAVDTVEVRDALGACIPTEGNRGSIYPWRSDLPRRRRPTLGAWRLELSRVYHVLKEAVLRAVEVEQYELTHIPVRQRL